MVSQRLQKLQNYILLLIFECTYKYLRYLKRRIQHFLVQFLEALIQCADTFFLQQICFSAPGLNIGQHTTTFLHFCDV